MVTLGFIETSNVSQIARKISVIKKTSAVRSAMTESGVALGVSSVNCFSRKNAKHRTAVCPAFFLVARRMSPVLSADLIILPSSVLLASQNEQALSRTVVVDRSGWYIYIAVTTPTLSLDISVSLTLTASLLLSYTQREADAGRSRLPCVTRHTPASGRPPVSEYSGRKPKLDYLENYSVQLFG